MSSRAFALFTFAMQLPEFEAATIKPVKLDGPPRGGGGCHGVETRSALPFGRCVWEKIKVKNLILQAFPPEEQLPTSDSVTDGTSNLPFPDVAARIRIMSPDEWVTGGPGWLDSEYFQINAKAADPENTTQPKFQSASS